MSVEVNARISKALRDGLDVDYILSSVANVVIDNMVAEIPVDRGDARRSVKKQPYRDGYKVSPTGSPARYIKYVEHGTGKYRGVSTDYGRRGGGEVRRNRYTEEDVKMFKIMRKRGVVFSIKPNKFTDRATVTSQKPAQKKANKIIKEQLKKQVKI